MSIRREVGKKQERPRGTRPLRAGLGATGIGIIIALAAGVSPAQEVPPTPATPEPAQSVSSDAAAPSPGEDTEPLPVPPPVAPPPLAPQFTQEGQTLVSPAWQDLLTPQTPLSQTAFYQDIVAGREVFARLVNHEAWASPLPAVPGNKLEPGQPYAGLALLAQRLAILGDMPPLQVLPQVYEGMLVEGIKAFQDRHGLTVDGIIGRATITALDTTPQQRVEQIDRNLRRLDEAPPLRGPRSVVVNLPEFVLRTYAVGHGGLAEQNSMRVIVGRAMDTSTPLFDEDIEFIEFSPYWNVPASIARRETLPRIRNNPAYFDQQGFEFVTGDGKVVRTLSSEALAAVQSGRMRLRQRPGPNNAMGDIKFVLPNNSSIYLHHTASPGLFERNRRDLSHGCIRVEHPVALARFILEDQPQWSEERIGEAMHARRARTLRLDVPVQVVITYSTVAVTDGKVRFFPDIYGHDGAKTRARPARPAPERVQHERIDVPSNLRQREAGSG